MSEQSQLSRDAKVPAAVVALVQCVYQTVELMCGLNSAVVISQSDRRISHVPAAS